MTDTSPLAEIESKIIRATPATALRSDFKDRPLFITAELSGLIRQWLTLKGVPSHKIFQASNLVLANAWAIGDPYVDRMKEPDNGKRPNRNRSRFGLDIDIFKPQELDGLFGTSPEPPKSDTPKIADEGSRVKNGELHSSIDADAIAKAADAVIGPRIAEATKSLRAALGPMISTEVRRAIESGRETMRQIVTETTQAVVEQLLPAAISRLVPKALEIRQNGELIRNLPAEIRHKSFDELFAWLSRGVHVYVVGPAGSGKTHLGQQLAQALGLDFYPIDQALTKYDVKGYKGPTGEYVGTLVRDCVEKGGLLMIDEGDMWAAAALGALNSILANKYGAFPDRVVQTHPNFRCMLCANTYGQGATRQYQGRNPLDAASRNRFVFVEVNYDPDLEIALYGDSPWLQYVHRVRKAVAELKLQHIVSTRAIQQGLEGIATQMLSIDQIVQSVLWQDLEPDTIAKITKIAGPAPSLQPQAGSQRQSVEPHSSNFTLSLELMTNSGNYTNEKIPLNGDIEYLARRTAENMFHDGVRDDKRINTIALMQHDKILDIYDGEWNNEGNR